MDSVLVLTFMMLTRMNNVVANPSKKSLVSQPGCDCSRGAGGGRAGGRHLRVNEVISTGDSVENGRTLRL